MSCDKYFDRPLHPQPGDTRQAIALRHGGVSDYPNRSAGWAVRVIGIEEQAAVHTLVTLINDVLPEFGRKVAKPA